MRYYYEQPENYISTKGVLYKCDHPLYNSCTLYLIEDAGLAVIQKHFNYKLKIYWWGGIDPWLTDDIYNNPNFAAFFKTHAEKPANGLYPTVTIRKLMWALRMKPLPKEPWEAQEKHTL